MQDKVDLGVYWGERRRRYGRYLARLRANRPAAAGLYCDLFDSRVTRHRPSKSNEGQKSQTIGQIRGCWRWRRSRRSVINGAANRAAVQTQLTKVVCLSGRVFGGGWRGLKDE